MVNEADLHPHICISSKLRRESAESSFSVEENAHVIIAHTFTTLKRWKPLKPSRSAKKEKEKGDKAAEAPDEARVKAKAQVRARIQVKDVKAVEEKAKVTLAKEDVPIQARATVRKVKADRKVETDQAPMAQISDQ